MDERDDRPTGYWIEPARLYTDCTTTTTLQVVYTPTVDEGSTYYRAYESRRALQKLQAQLERVRKGTESAAAVDNFLRALPRPTIKASGQEQVGQRHSFQQLARIPCYRGNRTR